jgi:hypothetical protein
VGSLKQQPGAIVKLSPQQKSLLNALKDYKKQTGFKRKLKQRMNAENAREAKVALRYRDRMFQQAMRAAGIDMVGVEARQKRADDARDAKYKTLAKELLHNAKHVKARQDSWRKRIVDHHLNGPGPFADTGGILTTASATMLDDHGSPKNAVVSAAPNSNLLTLRWDTTARHSTSDPYLDATFNFFLMPTQTGNLEVIVPIVYNGSLFWNTYGACLAGISGVNFYAGAEVTVMQDQGNGVTSTDSVIGNEFSLYEQGSACLGGAGTVPLEGSQLLQNAPLPVQAGVPVVISVDLQVSIIFGGAHVILDFASGVQSINVAGVLFGIQ